MCGLLSLSLLASGAAAVDGVLLLMLGFCYDRCGLVRSTALRFTGEGVRNEVTVPFTCLWSVLFCFVKFSLFCIPAWLLRSCFGCLGTGIGVIMSSD